MFWVLFGLEDTVLTNAGDSVSVMEITIGKRNMLNNSINKCLKFIDA